jgi:hypothetical protein
VWLKKKQTSLFRKKDWFIISNNLSVVFFTTASPQLSLQRKKTKQTN